MRVFHIAYCHRIDDIRIFEKECKSLSKNGFFVKYVTSDKLTSSFIPNDEVELEIVKLKSNNRVIRLLRFYFDILCMIFKEKPDVCHLHDFQLFPLVLMIPKNIKVIIDSHEDFPAYLADTTLSRLPFSLKYWFIEKIEKFIFSHTDYVITATPYIKNKIKKFFDKVECVSNFPILFDSSELGGKASSNQICFTGGAGESLGLTYVAQAIRNMDIQLVLAGYCDAEYLKTLNEIAGPNKVVYLGYLSKTDVKRVISNSIAGIVTYLPTANCLHAVPNKMFEYLERSTPIIYSNFEDWCQMLDSKNCGISVDPYNPIQIRNAIALMKNNVDMRTQYSKNARKAVVDDFNWQHEEKNLLRIYNEL